MCCFCPQSWLAWVAITICYTQQVHLPLPIFLVSRTPILLRWQHDQERDPLQRINQVLSQVSQSHPSLFWTLARDWFGSKQYIQFQALRLKRKSAWAFWDIIATLEKWFRAPILLSTIATLKLPVSEFLFMWNYKPLLPKLQEYHILLLAAKSTLDYIPYLTRPLPKHIHITISSHLH
jgi:hypothetical protein